MEFCSNVCDSIGNDVKKERKKSNFVIKEKNKDLSQARTR